MHVDPSFRSASASAKRDFPSIRLYRVIHVTVQCIYVYISRTKQALRRLDPVGIIYRLARNGPLLWSSLQ